MLIDWLISKLRGKNSSIPYQVNTYSGRVEVNPEDVMKSNSFKSSMSDVKKLRELVENSYDSVKVVGRGTVRIDPREVASTEGFIETMELAKGLVDNRCDTLDLAELANEFLHLKRCKSCTRLTLDEYICYWCKHDES